MSQTDKILMGTMTEKLLRTLATESYHYAAVKGSPFATDCHVFGMTQDEVGALCKRFPDSGADIVNGLMIKGSYPPLQTSQIKNSQTVCLFFIFMIQND